MLTTHRICDDLISQQHAKDLSSKYLNIVRADWLPAPVGAGGWEGCFAALIK